MSGAARALANAITHLIEANAALRKRRALAKRERALERALAAAFRAEGEDFLARFAWLRPWTPPAPSSFAFPLGWEPLFDEAATETAAAFVGPIDEAAAASLSAGMTGAVADLGPIGTSFDLEHPRAVEYLRDRGAAQVTRIRATTRETLRLILTQAADEGWSYDRTARAIRARYRHFSRTRARNIAVFEVGDAYEFGNMLVATDLQSAGLAMEKAWLSVGDARVRPEHRANQAQGWIPLGSTFQDGSDRPPTDPGCLPGDCRVAAEGITATSERRYEGDLVVVFTASDKKLACTPNHPILTPHGWVGAGLLREGDDVISSGGREWMSPVVDVDNDDMPATIKEVARAFRRASKVTARPVVAAPAFHGDGEGSQVAVVRSHGFLRDSRYATVRQHLPKLALVTRIGQRFPLSGLSALAQRIEPWGPTACRGVRFLDLAHALLWRHLPPLQPLRFALVANGRSSLEQPQANDVPGNPKSFRDAVLGGAGLVERDDLVYRQDDPSVPYRDAGLAEALADEPLRDAELVRNLLDGSAGEVFADQIVRVDRMRLKTHVYNLQTVTGAYVAEGIVTHNCRCTLLMRRRPDA